MCADFVNESFKNLYALKTKETLDSIKLFEDRLNCLTSSESDEEDVGTKENRFTIKSKTVSNVPNKKTKRGKKRKKETNENFVDSIILEEIDDYVPIGEKYVKSNIVNIDTAVNCTIDDEERVYTHKPETVTGSIVIDDIDTFEIDSQNILNIDDPIADQCIRSNRGLRTKIKESETASTSVIVIDDIDASVEDFQNVSNINDEKIAEPRVRSSKRLRNKGSVNYTEEPEIVFDGPMSQKRNRNTRTLRRSSSNDDIPVITFDEEYPISECSYVIPSQKNAAKKDLDADQSINDDATSESVTVFVRWRGNDCEKFEMPRYRPLKVIFDHYAEFEGIPMTCVVLTKDSNLLTPKDTPDSADFKVIEFLQGFKANVEQIFENKVNKPVVLDENDVELKVLLQNKRPLMLTIKKNQPMKVIIAKCAAQLECPEEDIVLLVDGEKVDLSDTPEDLDLQSGECVDAHVKNLK